MQVARKSRIIITTITFKVCQSHLCTILCWQSCGCSLMHTKFTESTQLPWLQTLWCNSIKLNISFNSLVWYNITRTTLTTLEMQFFFKENKKASLVIFFKTIFISIIARKKAAFRCNFEIANTVSEISVLKFEANVHAYILYYALHKVHRTCYLSNKLIVLMNRLNRIYLLSVLCQQMIFCKVNDRIN